MDTLRTKPKFVKVNSLDDLAKLEIGDKVTVDIEAYGTGPMVYNGKEDFRGEIRYHFVENNNWGVLFSRGEHKLISHEFSEKDLKFKEGRILVDENCHKCQQAYKSDYEPLKKLLEQAGLYDAGY